jgi:fructose-bisphosphate aldolase class II
VDALAISVGNRHGFYKAPPVLDIARLETVRRSVGVPLVLHGGSDIPESEILRALKAGVRKVNVGTDLKFAFFDELRKRLSAMPMPYQPPQVLASGREAVRSVTRGKIRLFGSSGLGNTRDNGV